MNGRGRVKNSGRVEIRSRRPVAFVSFGMPSRIDDSGPYNLVKLQHHRHQVSEIVRGRKHSPRLAVRPRLVPRVIEWNDRQHADQNCDDSKVTAKTARARCRIADSLSL